MLFEEQHAYKCSIMQANHKMRY